MTKNGIGAPVPRENDRRLLTGGGRYLDDIAFEDQAHGFVLRSPHAHARIAGIDTSAAARIPGVLAVLDGTGLGGRRPRLLPLRGQGRPAGRRADDRPAKARSCAGPRAVRRRPGRLCRGGDRGLRHGRGRAHRGRLRALVRGFRDRSGAGRRRAGGLALLPGQCRFRARRRRRQGGRRGVRGSRACRPRALRDQPDYRGDDGAARLRRVLRPAGRPLHPLLRGPERAHPAPPARTDGVRRAGTPRPGGVRRYRRQLRDARSELSRADPRPLGGAQDRAGGQMGSRAGEKGWRPTTTRGNA